MERDIITRANDRLKDVRKRLLEVIDHEEDRKRDIDANNLTYFFFDAQGDEIDYLYDLESDSYILDHDEFEEKEGEFQEDIEEFTLKPLNETVMVLNDAINSLSCYLDNKDLGLNPIDDKLNQIILTNDEEERNKKIDILSKQISSDIDEFAQAILHYKQQESELLKERQQAEDDNRAVLDEIDSKGRQINSIKQKRLLLDRILYEYCSKTGLPNLQSSNYSISFGKQGQLFALTPTYLNQIVNEIRDCFHLPEWINLELKVNQKAAREAKKNGEMPDDVVVTKTPIFSRVRTVDKAE